MLSKLFSCKTKPNQPIADFKRLCEQIAELERQYAAFLATHTALEQAWTTLQAQRADRIARLQAFEAALSELRRSRDAGLVLVASHQGAAGGTN